MPYLGVSDLSIADLVSLSGGTAVVTGGAAGIGRAIGKRLAEAGATLVIGDLDEAKARQTAAELAFHGSEHFAARLDVNDHASVTALADFVVSSTGRLDIW